jgi:hypothetical protein
MSLRGALFSILYLGLINKCPDQLKKYLVFRTGPTFGGGNR